VSAVKEDVAALIARAEALIPALRSRSLEVDANRRVADETVSELLEADLLQMMAPNRFGGPQADLATFLDVGIRIAQGCGSTGWVFGILGCHHWILSHFPLEAQEELYAGKNYALWPLSFSGKGGTAREVEGGFMVNGRWGFGSGIDFCDWVGAGVLIDKENPHDLHDRMNVIMRRDEVEVIDTWFTSGMRGTGSRDFEAKEVFVPHHRVLAQGPLQDGDTPGAAAMGEEYPLLAAPFYGVLMAAVMCPVLGITRRVIDDFVDFTKERQGFRGAEHATRAATQMLIGSVNARYDAMYRVVRGLYEEIDETAAAGNHLTVEQRLRQRRDAAYAAEECMKIVDELVSRAGARAQHQQSQFQLAQRDIHTIRTHVVLDVEEVMQLYGAHVLDLENTSVRF